jgi:protein gp37
VRVDTASLNEPLRWKKSRMVFVNSMSDLFHERVPVNFVRKVWAVMERAQRHTFQILTKRPERMAALTRDLPVLRNVWLGTSVESGDYLGRLDDLRDTRAHVRFVSFEPLLGSVGIADLSNIDWAIVGGESGPNARLMERCWVDEIHAACRLHDAAFFFKQWGGRNKKATGRNLDGRTWEEFPSKFLRADAVLKDQQLFWQPGWDRKK